MTDSTDRRRTDEERGSPARTLRAAASALRAPLSALRRHPARIAAAFAFALCTALLEVFALLLLVPLADALGLPAAGTGYGIASVTRLFGSALADLGGASSLFVALALLALVIALLALARHKLNIETALIVEEHERDLRTSLFRALARADWTFHATTRVPDPCEIIMNGVQRVGESLRQTVRAFAAGTGLLGCLAAAIYLSPLATVATGTLGALLFLGLRRPGRSARDAGEASRQVEASAWLAASDRIRELRTAKVHADEDGHCVRFADVVGSWSRARLDEVRAEEELKLYVTIGTAAAGALAVWAGTQLLGVLPLVVVGVVAARLLLHVRALRCAASVLRRAPEDHRAVEELLASAAAVAEPATWHGAPVVSLSESIQMDCASFHEPRHSAIPPVRNVSLEIPARRTTALVGPARGGKSTIGHLLTGLLVPVEGQILLDGRPLEGATRRGWRKAIGYVPRHAPTFGGTLREVLGGSGEGGSDDGIRHALRAAGLEGLPSELPHGLDTLLRSDDRRLTAGTRRRLALAGALARQPYLLLLEEAGEGDAAILHALHDLRGQGTILIITERLSSARSADVIHLVEDGRIVESGSWRELWDAAGRFRMLAEIEHGPAPAPAVDLELASS